MGERRLFVDGGRLERSSPTWVQEAFFVSVSTNARTRLVGRTRRAALVLDELREIIDHPTTELDHRSPYELLVAVILSAQCTDERVNEATPALFEAYPTVEKLAEAVPEEVYPYIQSITFPNNKAGYLTKMARQITERFGGTVPSTVEELQTLTGVGRKTARVVANVAFDKDALAVDTHVFRVANRIGLVKEDADTPEKVEQQLKRIIPREEWAEAHHLLILHGRYTCTARSPDCDTCPLPSLCKHYARLQQLPRPRNGLRPEEGAYYCSTCERYFDDPDTHVDRHDIEQVACSYCQSMQVLRTKSGMPTKQVKDYRVNG